MGWIIIGLVLVSSNSLNAQITISGKVTNITTQSAIDNVAIQLENSESKTYTNRNGFFSLDISYSGTLLISHPDYETDSIYVDNTIHLKIELELKVNLSTTLSAPILISGRAVKLRLPAAIMQIQKEHLSRHPDVTIAPALNRVTGVYMHSGAYNTNRITIRGIGNRSPFSTTKIRSYLDDIPLTNGDGETTMEDVDLSIIDKVEVWKGPTASNYGAGLGGMIHLKTNSDLSQMKSEIKNIFSVGSYSLIRNVTHGNYVNEQNSLQVGVNINTTHSDGYRENNRYDRKGISLLMKYISERGNETTFFGNLIDLKGFIPSSLNIEDYTNSPQKAAFTWASVNGFEEYSKHLFGVSQRIKISDYKNYTLSNKSSLFINTKDSYESRPFNILEEESNSHGLRSIFELKSKTQKNNTFPLFTLGLEYFKENYDWQTFVTNQGIAGEILSDNSETRKYLNLFVQSYWAINNKATLFTGLNFNSSKYDYDDLLKADGIDKSGDFSFNGILSPHIGFNYHFDYKLALFATISHGFSPPSLSETLNPNGTINPNISPEKGWNFELGSRGKFDSNFTYELTFYTMRIADLLVAKRLAEDQFIGLNAGSTKHNGVELFLEYQATISDNMKVVPFMTYTFSDYKFVDFVDDSNDYSGNELTGTPPHQLNLGIDFSSKIGIYGNIDFRVVDAFPMRDDNTIYSDSYKIANMKIGYKKLLLNRISFDLSVGLRNLFDEKYASMILINAGSFGGALPRYYYPGLPRNFFTSLSLQYVFGT